MSTLLNNRVFQRLLHFGMKTEDGINASGRKSRSHIRERDRTKGKRNRRRKVQWAFAGLGSFSAYKGLLAAGWPSAWVLIIRPRVVRSVATGGEALDTRGRMLFKKFRSLTVVGKGAGKVSGWRSRPSVKRRL